MSIVLFIMATQRFGFFSALAVLVLCAGVAAVLYMIGNAVHREEPFELYIDFKESYAIAYIILVALILFDIFSFASAKIDKAKTAEYKKGKEIGYETGYDEGYNEADAIAFEEGKEAGYEEFAQEFNRIFEEDWDDVRP